MHIFIAITSVRIGKYLGVFSLSIFKYLMGVAIAFPAGFTFWELLLTAGLGGCVGVVTFTIFGTRIRKLIEVHLRRSKTMPFKTRRRIVKIWRRFGIVGVAALTPLISPPVAVAIAVAFHTKPLKTIYWLCGSIIMWSILFALFRDQVAAITGW